MFPKTSSPTTARRPCFPPGRDEPVAQPASADVRGLGTFVGRDDTKTLRSDRIQPEGSAVDSPTDRSAPDRELVALLGQPGTPAAMFAAVQAHWIRRGRHLEAQEAALFIHQVGKERLYLPTDSAGALSPAQIQFLSDALNWSSETLSHQALGDACWGLPGFGPFPETRALWQAIAGHLDRVRGAWPSIAISKACFGLKQLDGSPGANALALSLARRIEASSEARFNGKAIGCACVGLQGLSNSREDQALVGALAKVIQASTAARLDGLSIASACYGLRNLGDGEATQALAGALAGLIQASVDDGARLEGQQIGQACLGLQSLGDSPPARALINALSKAIEASMPVSLDAPSIVSVCHGLQGLSDCTATRNLVDRLVSAIRGSVLSAKLNSRVVCTAIVGFQGLGDSPSASALAESLAGWADWDAAPPQLNELIHALAALTGDLVATSLGRWALKQLGSLTNKYQAEVPPEALAGIVSAMGMAGSYRHIPSELLNRYKAAFERQSHLQLGKQTSIAHLVGAHLRPQLAPDTEARLKLDNYVLGVRAKFLLVGESPLNVEFELPRSDFPAARRAAKLRDQFLESKGIRVVRIPASDDITVMGGAVFGVIQSHIHAATRGAAPPVRWDGKHAPPLAGNLSLTPARTQTLDATELKREAGGDRHPYRASQPVKHVAQIFMEVGMQALGASRTGAKINIDRSYVATVTQWLKTASGTPDETDIRNLLRNLGHFPPFAETNQLWCEVARHIARYKGHLSSATLANACQHLNPMSKISTGAHVLIAALADLADRTPVAALSAKEMSGACWGLKNLTQVSETTRLVKYLAGCIRVSKGVTLDTKQTGAACMGLCGLTDGPEVEALTQALAEKIDASTELRFNAQAIVNACEGFEGLRASGQALAGSLARVIDASSDTSLLARESTMALKAIERLVDSPASQALALAIARRSPEPGAIDRLTQPKSFAASSASSTLRVSSPTYRPNEQPGSSEPARDASS